MFYYKSERRQIDLEQKKKILSDSIWSVAGLVFMNVALQFAVYPVWERRLGEAGLGGILYLISLMNVFSVSMGVSVNYARMKNSAVGDTTNKPYLVILAIASAIAFAAGVGISLLGGVYMSFVEIVLFGLVMCATMWRYYADVEYKLFLNYKSFFLYYLFISIGYVIGIGLFFLTGLWPLTLLVGELFGLSYVLLRGRIFRFDKGSESISTVSKMAILLFGSEALSTLIFNADRIMLKALLGDVEVTKFYLASLLGKTIALLTVPLSGVVIGYLSKYKGTLKVKGMNVILALSVGAVALATVACTVGSFIVIPILYPSQFDSIRTYFIVTNLSQVLYFVANVITVVLLRFASSRYQLYVNAAYAISFVAICIPFTVSGGFDGFCTGLAITCFIRFITSVLLGYYCAVFGKRTANE